MEVVWLHSCITHTPDIPTHHHHLVYFYIVEYVVVIGDFDTPPHSLYSCFFTLTILCPFSILISSVKLVLVFSLSSNKIFIQIQKSKKKKKITE